MLRKIIDVKRPSRNSIAPDGTVVLGDPIDLTIRASIQPADKEQLEQNPYLRDFKQVYLLYSSEPLNVSNPESNEESDIVSIYGTEFEVISCEYWLNNIRSHYKIMIGR